jgi:hypothetical protein
LRFTDCTLTLFIFAFWQEGKEKLQLEHAARVLSWAQDQVGCFKNTNPSCDFVAFVKASHKL